MKNDYLAKTISSYNKNSHKYLQTTKDMILISEVETFLEMLPPHGSILDAGCGYGKYVKLFLEKGFEVLGIDLSEGLLKEAQKYVPNGKFLLMDVRKLDLADDTFSGIWCAATLLHLTTEDIAIAFKELYRVLKKGGLLFVTFKEGEGSTVIAEDFGGKKERFYTFLSKKELEDHITKAGFTLLEIGGDNERKRYGEGKRDQNWIHAFAKK